MNNRKIGEVDFLLDALDRLLPICTTMFIETEEVEFPPVSLDWEQL